MENVIVPPETPPASTTEYAKLNAEITVHAKAANSAERSAAKIAKDKLIPLIQQMKEMLSAQGRRTDLGQPGKMTFLEWRKLNGKTLGSERTVQRLLKQASGLNVPTVKKFTIGDRLQEKGALPICVVTYVHAIQEDGSQEIEVQSETYVQEDGSQKVEIRLDGPKRAIDAAILHRFHAQEIDELDVFLRYKGAEYKVGENDAQEPTLTRTTTPTDAEVAKIAVEAKAKKKPESTELDKKLGDLAGTKFDSSHLTKKVGTKKTAVVKPPKVKGTPGPKKGAKAEKARLAAEADGATITHCTPGEGIEARPSKLEVELDAAAAERKAERDADADAHREALMGASQVVEPITVAEIQ
jgi:hypothetical protein